MINVTNYFVVSDLKSALPVTRVLPYINTIFDVFNAYRLRINRSHVTDERTDGLAAMLNAFPASEGSIINYDWPTFTISYQIPVIERKTTTQRLTVGL